MCGIQGTSAQRLLQYVASRGTVAASDGQTAARQDGQAAVVARLLDSVVISPEARRLAAS
jgi:hypothetical protein